MDDKQYLLFWKKFATMIGSGVPLVRTLVTLQEENGETDLGKALVDVIENLKRGKRFSKCIGRHPGIFGKDVVDIIDGGERQGRLDEVANTVSEGLAQGILSVPSGLDDAPCTEAPAEGTPIPEQVSELIAKAVRENASDIHFDPKGENEGGRIRFRIDGVLERRDDLAPDAYTGTLSYIKIMAKLDVAERNLTQCGRIKVKMKDDDEKVDLRVAMGPTVLGESACIRILRKDSLLKVLEHPELVFPEKDFREEVFRLAGAPYGLIVVTGPTGCGKTTTVYSLLARQDTEKCKVMSVEKPVEVLLPGAHQVEAKPGIGMSYAAVLRHFLRMDPDVIFCSDVPDQETASILLRTALTGHLVFCQLHAKDALGGIEQLIEIGLEPYLIGDAVIGCLSQRLVRRLCPDCKRDAPEDTERLAQLLPRVDLDGAVPSAPVGCPKCNNGYRGRRAIYELLPMSPELRAGLRKAASCDEIEQIVKAQGFRTMFENAVPAIAKGEVPLCEVLRVCTAEQIKGRS